MHVSYPPRIIIEALNPMMTAFTVCHNETQGDSGLFFSTTQTVLIYWLLYFNTSIEKRPVGVFNFDFFPTLNNDDLMLMK